MGQRSGDQGICALAEVFQSFFEKVKGYTEAGTL